MTERERLETEFAQYEKHALYCATKEEWHAAVAALLAKRCGDREPTLADIVAAAKDAKVKCDNCNGTGMYVWGACVNGRMSKSGPCFRCQQKGKQGQEDFKRNWGYDNFHRRFA